MVGLDRIVARVAGELERHVWRMSRMRRPGVVAEYDAARHMARVRLTTVNGQGGLTPWAEVEEASGGGTSRTTLTVGQPVWVNCPNGDIRLAKISAGTFSDNFKSSSQATDETRFERGDVRVAIRPDGGELSFGDTTVTVRDGKVQIHTTGTGDFT